MVNKTQFKMLILETFLDIKMLACLHIVLNNTYQIDINDMITCTYRAYTCIVHPYTNFPFESVLCPSHHLWKDSYRTHIIIY